MYLCLKMRILRLFALASGLFLSIFALAQDIPVLQADPAVSSGVLPNGTSYFIASNPSLKKSADVAIVQRTGLCTTESAEYVCAFSRDILSSVGRTGGRGFQKFMQNYGAEYGKDGFATVTDDATVFRFNDMDLSETEVLDSVLLSVFDLIDRLSFSDDAFVRKWYAPSDHAVIVAGDVDPASLAMKMKMLSLMTPKGESQSRKEYKWIPAATEVRSVEDPDGLADLKLTWKMPRASREYMGTVQPLIHESMVHALGEISKRRVWTELYRADIPVAGISWTHIPSSATSSDESFSFEMSVMPEDFRQAVEIVARTFSSIDAGQVNVDEYAIARNKHLMCREAEPHMLVSRNQDYVDKCISSFLYGTAIVSKQAEKNFLRYRYRDDAKELELFNRVASAVLDPDKNLVIESGQDQSAAFRSAWQDAGGSLNFSSFAIPDSLSWRCPIHKVKVRSSRKDPMSGGRMWTFTNGFRVIFKSQPSAGKLEYALSLNGGYANVSGLNQGEGAFLSDYLHLCKTGDLDGAAFDAYLTSRNISLESQVNLYNTVFSGYAYNEDLSSLMETLLAVANRREHDKDAFDFYRRSQDLEMKHRKGSIGERIALIDDIMCPGYIYSSRKNEGRLTAGLGIKADEFFISQSGKMNDGVLILVGDVAEDKLLKSLLQYVGGFRTEKAAFARPVISYQPVSGCTTYTVDGQENSIDIAMSARMMLTIDNVMASAVASDVMQQWVSDVLKGTGYYAYVNNDCSIYPQERLNMMLSVRESSDTGFEHGTEREDIMEVLNILRSFLSEISDSMPSDLYVAEGKGRQSNIMAEEIKSGNYWMKAITRRYLDGKDFTKGYEARINAVSPEKVRSIFASLHDGSKVEYVVSKR